MAVAISDCGIFSTPRREPSLRVMVEEIVKASHTPSTPKISKLSLSSPQSSQKAPETPSTSDFILGSYKSAKVDPSCTNRQWYSPATELRKKRDGINKGVGHGIKKPKTRILENKKKKEKVKVLARRVKKAPCIPANRSPLKPSSLQKKLQVLSPPGVSLLDDEVPKEYFIPEPTGSKFFTSRSRAAATVQIGKNIQLSAKYRDVSLKQRDSSFAKRNVGRLVEEELNQYLDDPRISKEIHELSLLPSVKANPRPTPTRVASSPSPTKRSTKRRPRTPSPNKKGASVSTSEWQLDSSLELEDLEMVMKDWDQENLQVEHSYFPHCNTPKRDSGPTSSTRRSPRKLNHCASPAKTSPVKRVVENHTQPKGSPHTALSRATASPIKKPNSSSATVVSPGKLKKASATPVRRSPRKLENPRSWKKQDKGEQGQADPNTTTQGVKYFPIFYPNTRLADCTYRKDKNDKRKSAKEVDESQMMIDAGQKKFGAQQCLVCGLVFEEGNTSDEVSHSEYHNHLFKSLKFMGWKKEKLVREPDHHGGRVVMVSGEDPQHWWQKVEEVREVVDKELGFSENSIKTKENTKVFLYVLERQVVGCLIAERIDKAYRVIPEDTNPEGLSHLVCCSLAPTKVWVGISRIWVLRAQRGKHIATTLVDAMRNNMVKNHFLNIDHFAFSDPTEIGLYFAEKYTGKKDFLVYRREI